MKSPQNRYRLVLIPAPLDFGCEEQTPITDSLPASTLQTASQITHWICENAKSCRAVLKRIGEIHPLATPIQQQQIIELPREVHKKGDHNGAFDAKPWLLSLIQTLKSAANLQVSTPHTAAPEELISIGLMSEAGMPAVADPGSSVVRAAHSLGWPVIPCIGPSSLLLALAASGLNGQNFAFVGYLPTDSAERQQRLKTLEALAHKTQQTQLFIETPHRNAALWQALIKQLQPQTRLLYASGLTLPSAYCNSMTVREWRQQPEHNHSLPAIMGLGV